MKKIMKWFLKWHLLILSVCAVVLSVLSFCVALQKPQWGIVDTSALIKIQAQKIVRSFPKESESPELLHQLLQDAIDELKESIQTFAQTHHFYLLPKHALWGGNLPDYTEDLIKVLKKES